MTREEAITVLESDAEYLYSQDSPYCREAYRMAVEALEAEPNSCEYWDSESYFCALRRPQAELKHGRWLVHNILDYAKRPTGRKVAECSVCGQLTPDFRLITEEPNWNYCPNCGARMDEVEE